jgi:hypothetical protein
MVDEGLDFVVHAMNVNDKEPGAKKKHDISHWLSGDRFRLWSIGTCRFSVLEETQI